MKKLCFLVLLSLNLFAHEKNISTRADQFAYGKIDNKNQMRTYPWPFQLLSLGHLMQSFQNYGFSTSQAYWHDGLDIRSRENDNIYAAAGGRVVNIENYRAGNDLYWEVAILDVDGFVWKYHHVDPKTISLDVKKAFEDKTHLPQGSLIGEVISWPNSSFGEVYHHLHLLVVGANKEYYNPLLFLESLSDTKLPVIHEIGLAQNHRPIQGNKVKGAHALYLEATDLIYHEKFLLPPHKIAYSINGSELKTVWEFIKLPSLTNDLDFINDFYMVGTCGNYSCRKFYFNLNFKPEKPRDQMKLNPGKYQVYVEIFDFSGNKATQTFDYEVVP